MFYNLMVVIQCHYVPVLSLNPCASKRALTRNNFGDEGLFERGLTFRKRNPQRLLVGIADRKAEPS